MTEVELFRIRVALVQAFLREHHCAQMQGYLKAPPLPAKQCLALLQQSQREEVLPAP